MGTTPDFSCSHDGTGLFKLRGELDMATAPRFLEAFQRSFVLQAPWEVTIDLSGLTFVDSSGLRAFAYISTVGGCLRVVLESPTREVRKVLALSGLDQLPRIEVSPRSVADSSDPR